MQRRVCTTPKVGYKTDRHGSRCSPWFLSISSYCPMPVLFELVKVANEANREKRMIAIGTKAT